MFCFVFVIFGHWWFRLLHQWPKKELSWYRILLWNKKKTFFITSIIWLFVLKSSGPIFYIRIRHSNKPRHSLPIPMPRRVKGPTMAALYQFIKPNLCQEKKLACYTYNNNTRCYYYTLIYNDGTRCGAVNLGLWNPVEAVDAWLCGIFLFEKCSFVTAFFRKHCIIKAKSLEF